MSRSKAAQPPSRFCIPSNQAMARSTATFRCWSLGLTGAGQRHQDHRGIIGIGIEAVAIFETPTTRLQMAIGKTPIAGPANFAIQQPANTFPDIWRIGVFSASARAMSDNAVSQTGEKQGCNRSESPSENHQIFDLFHRPDHFRIGIGNAKAAQGNSVVNHGRKNRPNAIAIHIALAHPFCGLANRPPS